MMMFGDGAVRSLKENVEALGSQLATISAQSATMAAQLEAVRERSGAIDGDLGTLRDIVDQLAKSVAAQAEMIGNQAKQLTLLQSEAELRDESVRQLRAGLIRLEHQATSDFEEMRATTSALAHRWLAANSTAAAGPATEQPSRLAGR